MNRAIPILAALCLAAAPAAASECPAVDWLIKNNVPPSAKLMEVMAIYEAFPANRTAMKQAACALAHGQRVETEGMMRTRPHLKPAQAYALGQWINPDRW